MEGCDPTLLQRGVWVAVVVLQLLSWSQTCPGGAVTCCQSSSVLMEVGDGCSSQCWMCCSGENREQRGCSDHTAQCPDLDDCSNTGTQITGVQTSAGVGPRDLELNICVPWCFPFEKWVFSPCTSERMVVHTESAIVLGVVQVTSAVGWVVLMRGFVQKVHCRDCSFFDSSHML